MKRMIVTLVLAAGLGFFVWRIYVKVKERQRGPDNRLLHGDVAVAVEVRPVRKVTVRETGRFTGSLYPRSHFVVAPKISGRLEKLTVDVGDSVKSGQLIAELDDDELAQQVEQARAELAVAKATVAECKSALDVAARELERVKALHKKNVASESELDETEARHTACIAKHNVALAEVTRREAALKAVEVRLSYTRIHAVWGDGTEIRVVGERFVDEGEMLTPNAPIASILDNNVMTALIDIIERDYHKIKLGQPAVMTTDAFPDRRFTGKIVRIAPLLKEMSRQACVEIEIPNSEGLLKPGMFIRAQIEFDRHENATVVPLAALARRNDRQGVFLVDTEMMKARFVPVTLGVTEGEIVEVTEPVMSGFVATLGHHLLEDGATIRLPETGAADRADEQSRRNEDGPGGHQ